MKESPYAYKAFISHRMEGTGRKFSERLARFLLRFRTPQELLNMRENERETNPNLDAYPEQFGEIYYSVRSGVPSAIFADMPAKLQQSEYLIVVCTKDYAHPSGKWCYADIAAASFLGYPVSESERHGIPEQDMARLAEQAKEDPQKRERLRHIIPVIVRDARKVSKAEDCLSPFLDLLGNIGPDTGTSKEKEVFCDVAAKLLGPGVNKNQIYDRWAKEERIVYIKNLCIGIVLAVSVIWFFVMQYLRTHSFEKYYTDYVECFNEPKGLNPVSEEQLKHLNNAYRITERDSHTIRLEHCTFGHYFTLFATIIGRETAPPICEIEYADGNLRITKHQCIGFDGSLIQERHFMEPRGEDVQFYAMKTTASGDHWTTVPGRMRFFESADSELQDSWRKNLKVSRMSRIIDKEKGYVMLERFRDFNDEAAVRNDMGIFGRRYERDAEGRVTCCTFLDADDNPMADLYGAVTCEYTYFSPPEGPRGAVKSIAYYGASHELVPHHKGWAMIRYQYDTYGNLTSEKYFSPLGEPYLNSEGIAETNYKYDTQGRLIYESYYDTQGRRCENKDGFSYAKLEYSDIQNKTTIRYYDSFCQPVTHEGVFCQEFTHDGQGRPVSVRYLYVDGTPCLRRGTAASHCSYAANGEKQTISFTDLNGNPCCHENGHAKIVITYDKNGNETSVSFFGLDNKPYLVAGRAKEVKEYDSKGNCTSISFFDAEGKLCKVEGCAKEIREFDDAGNETMIQFFDETGAPCLVYGIAKGVMKYDKFGRETSRRYFGADDKPCLHDNGTAGTDFAYDSRGNRISQCFVGLDGKPTLHKDGVARQEYTYDVNNQLESVSNFDLEGHPCTPQWEIREQIQSKNVTFIEFGTTHKTSERIFINRYDNSPSEDYVSTERYLDRNEQPCLNDEGYSVKKQMHDKAGRVISESYFDTEGQPCRCRSGYAKAEYTYDENGNITAETYFDTNGHPLPTEP